MQDGGRCSGEPCPAVHPMIVLLQTGLYMGLLGSLSCRGDSASEEIPLLTTPYQAAVLLTNGQVSYGKLERAGSTSPVLTHMH
jgi:hypothetical protein